MANNLDKVINKLINIYNIYASKNSWQQNNKCKTIHLNAIDSIFAIYAIFCKNSDIYRISKLIPYK